MGFQDKYVRKVQGYNYAFIFITSNGLPTLKDQSDGMMRRLFPIEFPNVFYEGTEVWKKVPEKEYEALCNYAIINLPKILKQGHFTNALTIDEKRRRYRTYSVPLLDFIEVHCDVGDQLMSTVAFCMMRYKQYLEKKKRRVIGRREFLDLLQTCGYYVIRANLGGGYQDCIAGLQHKDEAVIIVDRKEREQQERFG
jgi:phage/plasmid-associated DNA primase